MAEPSESPVEKGDAVEDYKTFLNAINESLAAALTTSQKRYETIILNEETTKAEMARLRAKLEESQADQIRTKSELEITKTKLVETEMELGILKKELNDARGELDPSNSESEMAKLKRDAAHHRDLMMLMKTALKALETRYDSTQYQLEIAQTKLNDPNRAIRADPESTSVPSSEGPLPGETTGMWTECDTFCNRLLDEISTFSKTVLRDVHSDYEKALDAKFEDLFIKLASRIRLGPLKVRTNPEEPPIVRDGYDQVISRHWVMSDNTEKVIGPLISSFQANRDLIDPAEKATMREHLEGCAEAYALFYNDLDVVEKIIDAEFARLEACGCHEEDSYDLAFPMFRTMVDIKNGLELLQEHNLNWFSLGRSLLLALDDRMFTDEWDLDFKALVIDTIKKCKPGLWPDHP